MDDRTSGDNPGRSDPGDAEEDSTPVAAPGYLAGGGDVIGGTGPAELLLSNWPQFLAALRYPNYRMLWAGALVSNIGSWMENIARDWLVYQLGGDEGKFWLGVNVFADGVLLVVMLPLAGVLADRISRRWLLVAANAGSAILAAILAALTFTGQLRIWHILLLTALNGMMDAVRIPANQSLLPDLVARDDLSNAVALNSLQFNLSRVAGPALGGLTLVMIGPAWSFTFNAVSFLGVILPLILMRNLPVTRIADKLRGQRLIPGMMDSLRGGVTYVRSRADLLVMFTLVVLCSSLAAPVTKMMPAWADLLGHSAAGFAKLLIAFGVGAVVGAGLMAMRGRQQSTPWRAFLLLIGLGVCELLMSVNHRFSLALPLCGMCGVLFVGSMVRIVAAVMESTPRHYRGRVSSMFTLCFRMGMPLGGLAAGAMAQSAGLPLTTALFGAILIALTLILFAVTRKRAIVYAGADDSSDIHE
ncbi:MAG: MFS transporter [Phycisphaeraceae bacterium]|nr:MFS transporter [Phycisphaeraceae bacterium]